MRHERWRTVRWRCHMSMLTSAGWILCTLHVYGLSTLTPKFESRKSTAMKAEWHETSLCCQHLQHGQRYLRARMITSHMCHPVLQMLHVESKRCPIVRDKIYVYILHSFATVKFKHFISHIVRILVLGISATLSRLGYKMCVSSNKNDASF